MDMGFVLFNKVQLIHRLCKYFHRNANYILKAEQMHVFDTYNNSVKLIPFAFAPSICNQI